jgi:hypothetical protein
VTSLYTEVRVPGSEISIGRTDLLLMVGSCFADHIGQFFQKHKFNVLVNPLGIVFNPYSLSKNLMMAKDLTQVSTHEDLIVHDDGLWHSLLHHSTFSQPAKPKLIDHLNKAIDTTNDWLKRSDYIIITLGSAHVYRHLRSGEIVSNCHKLPASQFSKELLGSDVIKSCLHNLFDALRSINPKLQIVLTVSPVRYIRDGLVESNRSKAHLLSSVHTLVEQLEYCHYFPAYEIVIDELRDYRFYETDMVHPSDQAIKIVLQRFVDHWVDAEAREQIKLLGNLNRSMQHRPMHPDSDAYLRFINQLKIQINQLSAKYPDLRFSEELELLGKKRMV